MPYNIIDTYQQRLNIPHQAMPQRVRFINLTDQEFFDGVFYLLLLRFVGCCQWNSEKKMVNEGGIKSKVEKRSPIVSVSLARWEDERSRGRICIASRY